jgi:hypothetical protein
MCGRRHSPQPGLMLEPISWGLVSLLKSHMMETTDSAADVSRPPAAPEATYDGVAPSSSPTKSKPSDISTEVKVLPSEEALDDESTNCTICLSQFEDPVLLPRCGHSFCEACAARLVPTSGPSLPCPICRSPVEASSIVPNYALRQALEAKGPPSGPKRRPSKPLLTGPNPLASKSQKSDAAMVAAERLHALEVPGNLARAVAEFSALFTVRHVILDNSGSTSAMDGKVLQGTRMKDCSRWEEIKEVALFQASLSLAAGVPCEFRTLNPAMGSSVRLEKDEDIDLLKEYLNSAGEPRGGTGIARALRAIRYFNNIFFLV